MIHGESQDAMASTCPVDLDTLRLRAEIESIYRRLATEPTGDFHFHRGPTYAAEMLGVDVAIAAHYLSPTPAVEEFLRRVPARDTSNRRQALAPNVGDWIALEAKDGRVVAEVQES